MNWTYYVTNIFFIFYEGPLLPKPAEGTEVPGGPTLHFFAGHCNVLGSRSCGQEQEETGQQVNWAVHWTPSRRLQTTTMDDTLDALHQHHTEQLFQPQTAAPSGQERAIAAHFCLQLSDCTTALNKIIFSNFHKCQYYVEKIEIIINNPTANNILITSFSFYFFYFFKMNRTFPSLCTILLLWLSKSSKCGENKAIPFYSINCWLKKDPESPKLPR